MQAFLARIAAVNPRHNAIVSLRDGDALLREADALRPRAVRSGARARRGLAARPAAGDQGRRADRGPAHHLRLAAAARLRARRRRADGAAHEGGRLHRHRQDQHARVRPRLAHLQRGVRRHAQRLRPDADRPAAAAAAPRSRWRTRMLPVADGSDFMGSLRNPAGWNNVFGFRPSQGRVPAVAGAGRLGHAARHRRADGAHGERPRAAARRAGRLRRRARRCRWPRGVVRGRGSTTLRPAATARPRIGWLGDLGGYLAIEPGILDVCGRGLRRLATLGCAVEPIALGFAPERSGTPGCVGATGCVAGRIAPYLVKPDEPRPHQARGAVGARPGRRADRRRR